MTTIAFCTRATEGVLWLSLIVAVDCHPRLSRLTEQSPQITRCQPSKFHLSRGAKQPFGRRIEKHIEDKSIIFTSSSTLVLGSTQSPEMKKDLVHTNQNSDQDTLYSGGRIIPFRAGYISSGFLERGYRLWNLKCLPAHGWSPLSRPNSPVDERPGPRVRVEVSTSTNRSNESHHCIHPC